jgi:hypothetical protein
MGLMGKAPHTLASWTALAGAALSLACGGPAGQARGTGTPVVPLSGHQTGRTNHEAEAAPLVGVPTISSLPREHWPCAVVIRGSLVQAIEYGFPTACSFPPDRWQPGCPLRRGDTVHEYDEQGRLAAYLELGVRMAGDFSYQEDRIVSVDGCIQYHSAGDAVQLEFGTDCEQIQGTPQDRRVELDDQGRLSRIVHTSDGSISSTTTLVYAGPRLATRTLHLRDGVTEGVSLVWRYQYDCGP